MLAGSFFNLADLDAASVLDRIPEGIYITDRDRCILFWNKAAEEITGWKSSEVVGRRCRDNVLCHIDKDGHPLCGFEHCPLHRAMVTEAQSTEPLLIFALRRDGSRIPVEVMVSPLRNRKNEVVGGIEVFRDMSHAHEEMRRARIIQQETVGLHLPVDERFELHVRYTPHDQVGGDFYRAESMPDGTIALLVADVVGHGIASALYSMQLRALWEDGRELLPHPAEFLQWLSNRVEKLTDRSAGYFATAVFANFQPDTGVASIAVAGHPAPLIRRCTGNTSFLALSGPGLGLLTRPVYKTVEVTLNAGDELLFYTDGAFEVPMQNGEDMGLPGLLSLFSLTDTNRVGNPLDGMEENLLKTCKALALPDDLTLLLLRKKQ